MRSQILRSLATAARESPSRLIHIQSSSLRPSRATCSQNPNRLSQSAVSRPFSHSAPVSSSPFRLTSKPDTDHTIPPEPPLDGEPAPYYSPYKPKRQWPPDMSKLSPKHQFRLERKYRRRAALKFARPKWVKITKLLQWGVIGFVLIYALLFMEWDERGSPFDEIRRAFFSGVKDTFSTPPPPRPVRRVDDTTQE
ncbi:hypothetical protein IFM51744_00147 [Aspergillus udagawae]|uniref:Uncharacterized protein n=1 Tax=Aspergillus udagawae TaxID=91492 RepID=A0A8E0QXW5_9EURO|nr:uncharacterized protein Aud_007249 [Aspergillus udagawae]GFF26989.1 hypothetical protein IFM51744_00147 [Aspergillus udagawae]GFG02787.1 hypothetical protein IFM5058_01109 [Aspergillus udagawae]GIC90811.1 hypothetical protein Aud_007249 [Aspergillus udagawae]